MSVEKKYHFRFVMIMTGFMGVVLLTYRDGVVGSLFSDFSVLTAQATLMLLHFSGIEAVRAANQIFHPGGFVYEICYRCTGLLPMAFFTTAVLAHRAPLRFKIAALAGGLPILIAINLTRLVHLFYVGAYHRDAFDAAHLLLWQPIMILVTFGMWYGWTRLAAQRIHTLRRGRHESSGLVPAVGPDHDENGQSMTYRVHFMTKTDAP